MDSNADFYLGRRVRYGICIQIFPNDDRKFKTQTKNGKINIFELQKIPRQLS